MDSTKSLPSYLSKQKLNSLLLPFYLLIAVAVIFSGYDQTPSGRENSSETHSIELAETTGVSRIEIADYHNPKAGGFYLGNSGVFYYQADDISFTTAGGDTGDSTPVSTPTSKPNLIVLTDMSSITAGVREPDDAQSMIRLMLYSNEFDIKGLVASSSLRHGQTVHPEYIETIVEKYGQVRPNLLKHKSDYPTESYLKSVIKSGQSIADEDVPVFNSIGNGKGTEGSNWIIQKVDDASANDPVWIAIWGGPADLAQALWKVRETRSSKDVANFVSKIRVITSGDQDKTGPWIKSNFSDLYYITGGSQARGFFREGDGSLVSSQWVQQYIKGHGALGELYPDYDGGGKFGPVHGIKSGDSPTFMGLIRNGLNLRNNLTWLNWGGQRRQDNGNPNRYEDATADVSTSNLSKKLKPVWRWRPTFQADFQARLNWCTQSYGSANHNPVREDAKINEREVTAGDNIILHAGNWSDPDGDPLNYHWTVMPEESSYSGNVEIKNNNSATPGFTAPSVSDSKTIHVLLTVTDDGKPGLSSYQRFHFTINP